MALEQILEELNCHVITATSGQEALRITLKDHIALILLDVQMPGMTGFEVAELLRLKNYTQQIPIIFVTAVSTDRHFVFKGYEKGAVDYLFKPLEPVILQSKVKVFLELYSQRALLEQQTETLKQKTAVLKRKELRRKAVEKNCRATMITLKALSPPEPLKLA